MPRLVVRHSFFTSSCSVILCTLKNKQKQKHHFLAFLFWCIPSSFSRFLVYSASRSLQKKRNDPREIRTYLLYARSPAPSLLHYRGRHCRIATYIRHSISNHLISSVYFVYSAITTVNRSEVKISIFHAF